MKSFIKIAGVTAALAFAAVAQAQQASATKPSEASLIGSRYVSASLGYADVHASDWGVFDSTLTFNMPLLTNVDVGASYDYSWLEGHRKINEQVPALYATGYVTEGAFKPFATVQLGYAFDRNPGLNRDDRLVYGTAAGVEWSLNKDIAVTLSAGRLADFKKGDNASWNGQLAVTFVAAKNIDITAGVVWLEHNSVGGTLGVAYKF